MVMGNCPSRNTMEPRFTSDAATVGLLQIRSRMHLAFGQPAGLVRCTAPLVAPRTTRLAPTTMVPETT
jgi:hypothetical protein